VTDVITGLGPRWEASVATTLERVPGVTIARRCADVAELLSVAQAGVGHVAVVSFDLRGLDLDVVSRLRAKAIRVVGLHPADDEQAQRRLRQLAVPTLLPLDAPAADLAAAFDSTATVDPGVGDVSGRVADLGQPPVSDLPGGRAPAPWATSGRRERGPSSSSADETSSSAMPRDGDGNDGEDDEWSGWRPRGSLDPVDADRGRGRLSEEEHDDSDRAAARPERAPIVAVWGPTGAPGRTTVATTLAAEVASRGAEVLLVDADTYGGCIAQTLGLLDEAPGIAAACRAAEQGTLDLPVLAGLAPQVLPGLRVLTGLPKAERWTEVRAAALERVLELSRSLVSLVVVDCGFCLEDDEELSYDTVAPRRNESTLTSLAAADTVIAVGGADPVALQRFVRGLQELGTVPSPQPLPVVNRVRSAAVGSRPEARIAASLQRFAGLEAVRFVPDDPLTVDAAVLAGRSLVEQAPESPVRSAIADLASVVAPWTTPGVSRRRERGLRALSRR
jgi:MinD-like ATPase involved in chromosome partitioning or flagellar assembly